MTEVASPKIFFTTVYQRKKIRTKYFIAKTKIPAVNEKHCLPQTNQ